jgi:hypothetical protein
MADAIIIYGERPIDAYVLNKLNGSQSDREQFIENDFLRESGFLKSGNVKFRNTQTSEKIMSILHGTAHLFSFGLVPMKPFFEIEYEKLQKGEYYKFETIFTKSKFKDVSYEVFIIMELEYKLQIEFFNGRILQDNIKYYTDENIKYFEELILRLPNFPENIVQIKNRYLNELKMIRSSYERYKNPSDNYLRA